jgi:hypothetical protein
MRSGMAVRRRRGVTASDRSLSHRTVHRRKGSDAMRVKVRQVQAPEARSPEDEGKKTEAESDRKTNQIEV